MDVGKWGVEKLHGVFGFEDVFGLATRKLRMKIPNGDFFRWIPKSNGQIFGLFKRVSSGYLGLSPLPVRVTTRIITFLVGNPNLNLHFHYYWEGGQPNGYL